MQLRDQLGVRWDEAAAPLVRELLFIVSTAAIVVKRLTGTMQTDTI
jgi:hypothetical protein